MGIPACAAAKSAQAMVVINVYGTRSQGKQKHGDISLFSGKAGEPRVPGRLAANEHRNMELEHTPKASCLANGDILHVSGACLRSLGTGSLLC